MPFLLHAYTRSRFSFCLYAKFVQDFSDEIPQLFWLSWIVSYQIYVDDRTIDSHIKRLRKKFRKTDKSFDGIETLYGVGYKYKEA